MEPETSTEKDLFNIVLEGKLTIEEAAIKKDLIDDAYLKHQNICLNLENITDFDISGVQLLCAANMFFEKNKKALKIKSGDNNDKIIHFLSELGYYNKYGASHGFSCKNCLWKGDL